MKMQPMGCYVEDARAELPANASWGTIYRRAWSLQLAGETAEERNWQNKQR